MKVSTLQPACQWELWVVIPGRYSDPLQDCGSFGSERAAELLAAAVRLWLHVGVWSDTALAELSPLGREELLFLRRGMEVLKLDLATAHVVVREYGDVRLSDNRDSEVPGDHVTRLYPWLNASDPDDDDADTVPEPTPLAVVPMAFTRSQLARLEGERR